MEWYDLRKKVSFSLQTTHSSVVQCSDAELVNFNITQWGGTLVEVTLGFSVTCSGFDFPYFANSQILKC